MSAEFSLQLTLESFFSSVLHVMSFANLLSDSNALKYMPSGLFLSTEFILSLARHSETKLSAF